MISSEQFAQAYVSGFGSTRAHLCKCGASSSDAQEFAQAAWAHAWTKRNTYRGESKVASWVSVIAWRLFVTARKKAGRYVELRDVPNPKSFTREVEAKADAIRLLCTAPRVQAAALRERYLEDIRPCESSLPGGFRLATMRGIRTIRNRMAMRAAA